jgi:hypothetical protein
VADLASRAGARCRSADRATVAHVVRVRTQRGSEQRRGTQCLRPETAVRCKEGVPCQGRSARQTERRETTLRCPDSRSTRARWRGDPPQRDAGTARVERGAASEARAALDELGSASHARASAGVAAIAAAAVPSSSDSGASVHGAVSALSRTGLRGAQCSRSKGRVGGCATAPELPEFTQTNYDSCTEHTCSIDECAWGRTASQTSSRPSATSCTQKKCSSHVRAPPHRLSSSPVLRRARVPAHRGALAATRFAAASCVALALAACSPVPPVPCWRLGCCPVGLAGRRPRPRDDHRRQGGLSRSAQGDRCHLGRDAATPSPSPLSSPLRPFCARSSRAKPRLHDRRHRTRTTEIDENGAKEHGWHATQAIEDQLSRESGGREGGGTLKLELEHDRWRKEGRTAAE